MKLLRFLFDLIKPYKLQVLAMLCIGLYQGIYNSASPYVLKLIIDQAVAFQGNKTAVIAAVQPHIVIYLLLWVSVAIAFRSLDCIKLKLFPSIRYDIVSRMFAYLNLHSHRYFQNNFAGSLANKISDMQSATIAILTTIDDAFAMSICISAAIITMLLVHPVFALIALIWTISFTLIAVFFFSRIQDLSNQFATSKTTLMGKIVDSIGNITNIRLFASRSYENTLINTAVLDTVVKDRRMQKTMLKMRIYWDISIILLFTLNIYTLVFMYSKNRVSIGDFSLVIALSINIFQNLWFLANQFVDFARELGQCSQALTIINTPIELKDKPCAQSILITQGRIEFNAVSFHYGDGNTHLFKNKNIIIAGGQKVGLVGFSGSGKSSFVNLILRLFELESGVITIDGQDISTVTQDSLRTNIAMIPQDISLFHRSLMDNIRYGRIRASDDEVIAASKKAHCHEFINQLSDGYQTLVGERGIKLSGGQRQRIAIARGILKNAPILILDEATSALDSMTEKHIQESLHILMTGRTTIVIAHRLSTLAEMDRILVFDKGQIIEDGKHADLIQANNHYARMWQMQAGGFLPSQADK